MADDAGTTVRARLLWGVPAWIPVVALTIVAAAIRLAGLPGAWGTDALTYVDLALGNAAPDGDPRSHRLFFLALVRLGIGWGPSTPVGASLAGVLLSVAVVPVLWAAGRRSLGPAAALLAPALWTMLGLDLEEVVEVSADAALALPGALAAWALVAASGHRHPIRVLVLGGLTLGIGAAVKETMIFATVGFAVGAYACRTPPAPARRPFAGRWLAAAALVVPAAGLFGLLLLLHPSDRVATVTDQMLRAEAPVRWCEPEYLERLVLGVPQLLLTATGAFGFVLVIASPLLVRLVFRVRRDPLAATALAGVAAFAVLPVSLEGWALLPASYPRYFLCLVPVLFLALVRALMESPESRAERVASLITAAAGLAFVGRDVVTWLVIPAGLAAVSWPALAGRVHGLVSVRASRGIAAALLLIASAVAWSPANPGQDSPRLYRFVPDATWDAWKRLPSSGRVLADPLVARRLRIAATDDPDADATRVEVIHDRVPAELGPDDRILVRTYLPLHASLERMPGLRRIPPSLGETSVFARVGH